MSLGKVSAKATEIRAHGTILGLVVGSVYAVFLAVMVGALPVMVMMPDQAMAQTALGEIEGRAAPVSRRICVGGTSARQLCNQDSDCPGSTCQATNIFNISVSIRFNATAAQLTQIQNVFTAASQILFDATDGQAQLGQVTIFNNSTGARGHVWISSTSIGCSASTGSWGSSSSGNVNVGLPNLTAANGASCLAHELTHLIYDARDEYESRAAGCGAVTPGAQCPDSSQGANSAAQEASLMECCARVGTEYCWGQASGDTLTLGNHDATNVTEQSVCRSNRSVWDQVVWSWPNTHLLPAGAPDTGTGGLTHTALVFVQPPNTSRLVLVLDRSGSMGSDTPTRLAQLQTAALDVIDMAANGNELGIVSFSNSGTDDKTVTALGATRTSWSSAVNALTASGATNIGDGLQKAYDQIIAAGGVTGNTGIILMTDGINNRPSGTANVDLQAKLDMLLAAGIPVWVTCNGDDLGLDSQCSEIATATNGSYVDSADNGQLPEHFASFNERASGRVPTKRIPGTISGGPSEPLRFHVEAGANTASFLVQWASDKVRARVTLKAPDGSTKKVPAITQGAYLMVKRPPPGEWSLDIAFSRDRPTDDSYVANSYIENSKINAQADIQHPRVKPGEPFKICSRPLYEVPLTGLKIAGHVVLPDGSRAPFQLYDSGGRLKSSGDEIADDGTYCNTFVDTKRVGGYSFHLNVLAKGAKAVVDTHPGIRFEAPRVPNFERRIEISAAVDDGKRETQDRPNIKPGPGRTINPRIIKPPRNPLGR